MTHLEMLEEIAEANPKKWPVAFEIHPKAAENKQFLVLFARDDYTYGCTAGQAIESAYRKLFPPIPKKVGKWRWRSKGGVWESESTAVALREDGQHGGSYQFVLGMGPTFRDVSAYVYPDELQDFLKLVKVNPELKPPTEL